MCHLGSMKANSRLTSVYIRVSEEGGKYKFDKRLPWFFLLIASFG